MDDDYYEYKIAGVIVGFITGLVALLITIQFVVDRYSCLSTWEGYNVKWSVMTGCMISVKGNWIPTENYRSEMLPDRVDYGNESR